MDLLQGTLDMLILRILASGKRHGYDISKRILILSKDDLKVGHGSMYPALHRLEKKGFIRSEMGQTEKGRDAKFYELTSHGREQIDVEKEKWQRFVSTIETILNEA